MESPSKGVIISLTVIVCMIIAAFVVLSITGASDTDLITIVTGSLLPTIMVGYNLFKTDQNQQVTQKVNDKVDGIAEQVNGKMTALLDKIPDSPNTNGGTNASG